MKSGRDSYSRKFILILLLLLLSAAALLPGLRTQAADKRRTVKVAVLNNSVFAYQDENGVWSGMDVELMISIAQKADFDVEFIDSGADPDFLGNLDNGTYDMVADVAITPEREEKYLFTDESMGSINNTLAVRADDNRWDYGNIDQVSNMKIGTVATYANNSDFRTWCSKHRVTPVIIEYKDTDTMTSALKNGEIDGEVYSAASGEDYTSQFRTIMKFLPETYAFAFRKDDVELKNRVDAAIAQILSVNIDYLTNLKNKYETQFNNNVLPLSSEEKDYIAKHPVITVAVTSDDHPYYEKAANGEDKGIIPDYYKLLTDWSGLQFRYSVFPDYDSQAEAVREGKADILGMYGNGLIAAYQEGLSLTDSISSVNCILLTNPGFDISKVGKVAVLTKSSDSLQIGLSRLYPDAKLLQYANAEECFDAVRTGKTDAALVGLPSATWLINQTNSTLYSVIPVSGISFDLCAAVREDEQTLCSILNKGIAVTKGKFTGIVTNDTLPDETFVTTISRMPPVLTLTIIGVLLVLVIGLMWTIIMLRMRQKERAALLAAQAETERERIRVEEIQRDTEAQNRFFANISHDMRTPLNAILGFATLAEKEDIDEEKRRDYLSKIHLSGKLLMDLVNDTLTLSKVNSGKLELKPEPARARELFESIIVPIRETAAKKNIAFTVDYSGMQDRTILVDELSLQKILLNLLSNAVQYTQEGGHVRLRLYNDPPEGKDSDSVIVVQDDGIGISPEFLPHVFEPFAQEKRHGYESVGTGLGLSIVKQLVDLMGGTIQVQSEEQNGTTFTVRLHLKEAEGGMTPAAEQKSAPAADLRGRKILLCEDNALNVEIAVAFLKEEGMSVDVAGNGLEGVRKFRKSGPREYSAILMDLRMPVMDGLEAARKIRSSEHSDAGTIPIIAMTADALGESVRAAEEAGMNGYLTKPVDPKQLYEKLAAVLSAR
ncbi:MAG: transporter substrate-binding domain-containing protein [Lachnospiraceae bacterium]|jgi:signal transduction histidine kinase|nr:transporter substrate-binding domain-containing protein [Lachnospiraceae bacterium]